MQKKWIILIILISCFVVLLIALSLVAIFLFKKLRRAEPPAPAPTERVERAEPEPAEDASQIEREKGKSNGISPYASFDQENVVAKTGGSQGMVLETMLSGGIKAFLIIPEENVTMSATVSLLPYTELPSSSEHPALSDQFGYGVEVVFESTQMGLWAYLVFDLEGGKGQEQAASLCQYFNRCDPAQVYFHPLVCARLNQVPINQIGHKDYTVVAPIHNPDFPGLIFTLPTYPIGLDSLVVTKVTQSGAYLLQPLDRGFARELVTSTIGSYGNYGERVSAGDLAQEWDLGDELTADQVQDLVDAVGAGGDFTDQVHNYFVADWLLDLVLVNLERASEPEEREDWQYVHDDLRVTAVDIREDIYEDAIFESDRRYLEFETVEAAAVVGGMADRGEPGAEETQGEMEENLDEGFGSTAQTIESRLNDIEAQQLLGDEKAEGTERERFEKQFRDLIDQALADPNVSVVDLMRLIELTKKYGMPDRDELIKKLEDKIREILEERIADSGVGRLELLHIASLCQSLGFNDLADKAMKKAEILPDEECDETVKKSLKNYGIQDCP